ncbi:type IVB secretion system protein IcmH/DotU [Marinibactrum halimedae]|uniref:Type IV / VI secretion system DotU domain-containing protein n=1 Tax=Marinibactrum halimedae TaxID=1444977 RepID=A0AA37TBF8_9GAMM|nr:type IVB secretion system protein IcmH/DotU [Marinibactrum halimedae]MCD9458355.1 type IVB secretion system protein IcmH/DotU [Marinibactrum halimedae]GLS26052.1 hypothetical protein GCM10007877_17670 [Marinibactrum halimedae]
MTNGDRTIMIPNPGGRGQQRPDGAAQQPPPPPSNNEPMEFKHGLNPLINAASTLLGVIAKLRNTMSHDNPPDLHRRVSEEIKGLDLKLKQQNLPHQTVITARYLLCTVVDEIVLNTPWGANSGWSSHSLLSMFHQETFGGEKCFLVLQKLLEAPGSHLDLLELYYLCLSLGFEGKYRVERRGHEQLNVIRDNLYQTIANHRPPPDRDLSPKWQGLGKVKKHMINYIPMWVIGSVGLLLLLVLYSGFRYWIYDTTQPTAEAIRAELTAQISDDTAIDSSGESTQNNTNL